MPRSLLLTLFVLALGGCYRYVPQRAGAIPVGSEVRIHLSSEGVRRIGEAYGSASGVLEGRLEGWSDEVVVTIPVPPAPGMVDRGLRNRIVIAQGDVIGIELKERDRARSTALSLTVGAVTAVAAIAIFGGIFGGGTAQEDPAPEDVLIPLWLRIFP